MKRIKKIVIVLGAMAVVLGSIAALFKFLKGRNR